MSVSYMNYRILLITKLQPAYLSINFDSQFSVVFNLSGIHDHTDNSEESVSEEVLKKATECTEEETMSYPSDDEFSQVWGTDGCGNYIISGIHSCEDIPAVF